ncbi:MAG: TIGR02300 family protein [Rhodomicrobium sp.]|nr:TIGR02300 family protein [Rhodomicrobium sp.]
MSIRAERGTKRVCQSCGAKFYDLNRDPIVCPICQSVYQVSGAAPRAPAGGNNLEAEDEAVLDAGRSGLEFVPLDEVAAREGDELPDIEGGDIADVGGEEEEGLDTGAEDEPFLEAEDEGEADMSGFVGGGKDDDV